MRARIAESALAAARTIDTPLSPLLRINRLVAKGCREELTRVLATCSVDTKFHWGIEVVKVVRQGLHTAGKVVRIGNLPRLGIGPGQCPVGQLPAVIDVYLRAQRW